MAAWNPHIQVPNVPVPHLGSHLTIQWSNVIALFAGIAGVHFVLFTSAIYVTRSVKVEESAVWPIGEILHSASSILDLTKSKSLIRNPCRYRRGLPNG